MMDVTLFIDCDHALYHASYVITGLFALRAQGAIALAVRHPGRSWRRTPEGSGIVHLLLRGEEIPGSVSLCLDLHDMSTTFHSPSLEHSDIYLKRSYFAPHIRDFTSGARAFVAPFGLNYACTIPRSLPSVIRCGLLSLGTKPAAAPLRQYAARIASDIVNYSRLLAPAEFTRTLSAPKSGVVFFQTRLWESSDVRGEDNAEAVNEERVSLVRTLKHAFGKRFWGGLTPSPLAKRRYESLISPLDTRQRKYIRVQSEALVGVYSRGLHFSNAWKLPEYLAAGMCVVASPLRNALPVPLRSGTEFLTYSTADECVEACEKILSDRGLQQHLRAAGTEYFLRYCEPSAHMLDCLRRAIALHHRPVTDASNMASIDIHL